MEGLIEHNEDKPDKLDDKIDEDKNKFVNIKQNSLTSNNNRNSLEHIEQSLGDLIDKEHSNSNNCKDEKQNYDFMVEQVSSKNLKTHNKDIVNDRFKLNKIEMKMNQLNIKVKTDVPHLKKLRSDLILHDYIIANSLKYSLNKAEYSKCNCLKKSTHIRIGLNFKID